MSVTAVSYLLDFIDNIFCPSRRVNLSHEFPHPLHESGFYRVWHEASPPSPSFKKIQATSLMDWNDSSKANHQEIVFMLRCNECCSHQNSIVLPYFHCLSQVLRVICSCRAILWSTLHISTAKWAKSTFSPKGILLISFQLITWKPYWKKCTCQSNLICQSHFVVRKLLRDAIIFPESDC